MGNEVVAGSKSSFEGWALRHWTHSVPYNSGCRKTASLGAPFCVALPGTYA